MTKVIKTLDVDDKCYIEVRNDKRYNIISKYVNMYGENGSFVFDILSDWYSKQTAKKITNELKSCDVWYSDYI